MSDSELWTKGCDTPAETHTKSKYSIPLKSKHVYDRAYKKFSNWRRKNKVSVDEQALLKYFTEHLTSCSPTTIWTIFSMLKATISQNNNIDISSYKDLLNYVKARRGVYEPKQSKPFTKLEFETFLQDADDNKYLGMKVS